MKPRDALLRASQFEVEEKRRKLGDIESMINDFRRMASDLDMQIEAEHVRSGVRDPAHFAYPPFAKAARQRRDNLLASVDDLKGKHDAARQEFEAAEEEHRRLVASASLAEQRPVASRRGVPGRNGKAGTATFRHSTRA